LTSLPSEIGQLSNLKNLYLHNNQLNSLPLEILNLSSLWLLSINNNLLCAAPSSIEEWIDNVSEDANWRNSQLIDSSHYCDGSEVIIEKSFVQEPKEFIILRDPYSQSITITFNNLSENNSIFIYYFNGVLLKKFEGIYKSITFKTVWQGIYYIKVFTDDKIIFKKIVL
jgi:Leucine-rich repeat (LRR) protein